jgi:uroporphyrinogen-III synthase
VPAAPDAEVLARLQRGEIDIVTVTSVEGLGNLVALAGERARPRLLATPLVTTSERQAEAARAFGFHGGIRVAARTGDAAILEALAAWRAAGNFL